MLALKRMCFQYDKLQSPVLSDIEYHFEQGKMYAIEGPSGSGKTTLLSLAAGLDVPTKGEIRYQGECLNKIGYEKYRRSIGIVFQSYNLIPYMTPMQNVITGLEISKTDGNLRVTAREALRSVGLEKDEIYRACLKLSGGQQQRVAIARAIAKKADLILADEPTGNLDEERADEIAQILYSLAQKGCCVICVTHSKRLSNICDVVLQIKKRKLFPMKKERIITSILT